MTLIPLQFKLNSPHLLQLRSTDSSSRDSYIILSDQRINLELPEYIATHYRTLQNQITFISLCTSRHNIHAMKGLLKHESLVKIWVHLWAWWRCYFDTCLLLLTGDFKPNHWLTNGSVQFRQLSLFWATGTSRNWVVNQQLCFEVVPDDLCTK